MACYHPITIRSPLNENAFIDAPCGKCPGCRRDLQNQWFLRFIEEQKGKICKFITLTYNDENIPTEIDEDGCIHYNVDKVELQRFFKRMRKNNKFKYFAVSEYGTETSRPHYHILLFSKNNIDVSRYWKSGFVMSLPASKGAFRYVTKYLLKGSNVPYGSKENFMICSKRPAIGLDYIDKLTDEAMDDKLMNPIMRDHQIAYPLPRYYRKKLYQRLNDGGEMIKNRILEELESSVYTKMYSKFLENHSKDDDFYFWLRSKEASELKKQIQIKKSCKI